MALILLDSRTPFTATKDPRIYARRPPAHRYGEAGRPSGDSPRGLHNLLIGCSMQMKDVHGFSPKNTVRRQHRQYSCVERKQTEPGGTTMTENANDQLRQALDASDVLGCLAAVDAGADVNYQQSLGFTALSTAASRGDANAVNSLLARGANVDAKNHVGATALFSAAINGHLEVVRSLVRAGADIEAQNTSGETALFAACSHGHCEVGRALLSAGAKPNRQSRLGSTPLMNAVLGADIETVRLLLNAGADVRVSDFKGQTAYQWALDFKRKEIAVLLKPPSDPQPSTQSMQGSASASRPWWKFWT
jgi:ankyrin repeat protein